MAELTSLENAGCQLVNSHEIRTHKNRGIAFRPKAPDPDGRWRNEKLVIEVEVFNLNCPQPWTANWDLNMVQAKELSQWLSKRTKEAGRGQRFSQLHSLLRLGRS